MSLDEIRENFDLLDDWEDRYRYIIELGRELPGLEEADKTEANRVRGCVSQVWLLWHTIPRTGQAPLMVFAGDSDAFIVRGLIAILLAVLEGKSAEEIAQTDANAAFAEFGLHDHLTPQRSNGLASMIQRIRADAKREAEATRRAAAGA